MEEPENDLRIKDWVLEKYVHGTIFFLEWYNNFEYVCEILNKNAAERELYLLTMINPPDMEIIREHLFPVRPFQLPYDEIVNVLTIKFTKFRVKEAPNMRILHRKQCPYETIEHYVRTLRDMHSKCTPDFKETVKISDLFIDGLSDVEIKTYLEKHKGITLSEAVNTARDMERAKQKNQKPEESSSK